MREIRKNPAVFVAILLIFTIVCLILATIFVNVFIKETLIILWIISEIAAILHFCSIRYYVSDEFYIKKSGIVFAKTKTVPLDKIVMKSTFSVGKTVFLTIIGTAGSFSVIFGEI